MSTIPTARENHIKGTLLTTFGDDRWTVGDAVEGVQVFGATGSGKTSGSGAHLARAFLDPSNGDYGGFGGLVLTAKGDERESWEEMLAAVGRDGDLLPFSAKEEGHFNFLAYEQQHEHDSGLTQNLVSLFLTALSGGGSASVSSSDPYWDEALREMLTHTVDLAILGGQKRRGESTASASLDLALMFDIVRSAPRDLKEAESPAWRGSSLCAYLLLESERRRQIHGEAAMSDGRKGDLDQTQSYWLRDFPTLAERTRSIVMSSFTAKAAGLLRSPLRELLCAGPSLGALDKYAPERSFEGRIILLELPVNHFDEVGRFAQILYKTVWQRAVWRRELVGDWRPVFLWADESQYFVTKGDALFQQTARSRFASTVYLTQNLPNYQAALGGGGGSEQAAESLLGNLQTKIFHANGDPSTNEWAERVFARRDVSSTTPGRDQSASSASFSRGAEPMVPARRFTELLTGGARNGKTVEGFVIQAGRKLCRKGTNVEPHPFRQEP